MKHRDRLTDVKFHVTSDQKLFIFRASNQINISETNFCTRLFERYIRNGTVFNEIEYNPSSFQKECHLMLKPALHVALQNFCSENGFKKKRASTLIMQQILKMEEWNKWYFSKFRV